MPEATNDLYESVSPEDAATLGAFEEDALSEADALASAGDPAEELGALEDAAK